ncbi:MAG: hypothetical protein J6Z12_00105, partial [Paludibacteraceae bacterium]|nr:hypothetical protein [Paludibacteraceae bacterium]
MKRLGIRTWLKAVLALALMSLLPQWASANDYLEKDKHYRAYANGADRVHFVIPVWAYGKAYDYYAYGDSYIAYKKNGDSDWTRIAWYKTDAYDENENKNTKKGTAYVWPIAGQGTIVVTSMSSGVDKRLTHSGSWSEQLIVKQREDDDCPQVTMLELDWYSPESLDNQPYQVKIESKFRRSYTDGNEMTCTTTYPDFRGNSNIMTPQLYSPYIYQVNDNGPTGYGFAAIPYMTFNDPVSYSTSLNPQHEPATSRGGTLYVMTNDTVQEQFYATFTLWRNKNNADSTSKKSTSVDIPPYHRIYNFTAVQELDSTGTCTGNNVLHWTIKNPGLKDLVDGDFFEIQRALNSNYSDARTIEVVQMLRNENKTQYTYTDESRETWNGNTDMTEIPVDTRLTVKEPKFVVYDVDGQPLAELNASLVSDELRVPTVPVYYRIRRASASVWGWDIDFTQKVTMNNYNFLAPLAETQEPYTLDEAYADNHQVHFSIKIENREPVAVIPDKDRCMLTCSVNKILREDPIEITVQFEQKEGTRANPEGTTAFRVLSDDERVLQNWSYLQAGTYSFPRNCMVQIKNVSGMTYNQEEVFTFRKIANPAVFTCTTEGFAHGSQYFTVGMVSADPTPLTPDKGEGDMDLQIKYTTDGKVPSPDGETAFRVVKQDGTVVKDWSFLTTGLYQFPTGSTVHVKNASARNYEGEYTTSFVLTEPSIITCSAETWIHGSQKVSATMSPNDQIVDGITREINSRLFTVKDSLYRKLLQEHHQMEYGKAMWDRTARLILTRTIEETGQKMEYIIPQDSIVRQADGSWTASFTDVADKACSHYTYTVRIDQSKSDLHVQDSTSLRPMTITGPDLYFDEGAAIRQMEASQGDAGTEMKSGVLVRWQTDTNNYDDFLLLRKPKGSSAAADTLALTTESSFFDRSAQPNVHYDYTVEARYSCNSRHTVNAATAEGWRTPYGEISGSILLPDNTGMAGVTVALQDGTGQVIRTITTDASGAYKFDSLAYADPVCEDPTLNLTISNTPYPSTIMLRVLDANGQVLENWGNKNSGTYTYKTGTVIEAKTTYESDQSYNQVHSFTLRKHSTLTIYTSRIVGQPSKTVFSFNETRECACSDPVDNGRYSVIPTSQYGEFSFNNSPTASITLAPNHAVASGIHFVNNSVARLTGRVLYKNTTIPVSGARFLLNGDTVRRGNVPLATGVNGNFELLVPLSQPCRLQVIKEGHSFEGDGILRVDGGEEEFALTKPLDGVRFYDTTKARLVGRVAGGNDQRDLPRGFGLGRNNLGDNLQLVLQLEGDNTAQLVHDPDDLDRDTLQVRVNHVVYQPGADSLVVGSTQVLFEKKRITIHPDPQTGEFAVDLFPVKYKVVQATATGYATLFGSEQGSETFDLTEAPKIVYTARYDQAAGEIIVGSNSPNALERHYPS